MKKFFLAISFLFAAHAQAQDLSWDELTNLYNRMQSATTDSAVQDPQGTWFVPGKADMSSANLTESGNRLNLIGMQLDRASLGVLKARADTSFENIQAVCRDVDLGLNLFIGAEALAGYWTFQTQFNTFKGIFLDTKNIFKCGGSAPRPPVGDRWSVSIQNAAYNQFCLNAQSNSNESPNNVYGCASHPDQKWNIKAVEGEYKHIQSNKFQVCLNLQDSYDYKETNLYQCNYHQDQEWKVRVTPNGQYMFESRRAPGKCLAMNQAYNEARTVIKGCYDQDYTQLWNVY